MKDYEKLKLITDEIDTLISKGVSSSDSIFQSWKVDAERFLVKKFGEGSFEHKKFIKTRFSLPLYTLGTPKSEFIKACARGLETTKAVFCSYLEEIQSENVEALLPNPSPVNSSFKKVFIVHGHNGELKQSVARIIEKQGIEAVILSEQVNQGRTIIEKFEDYSDVSGAICLFSADDIGKAKTETDNKPRARQNVVLETGYFMGKLGRKRIVILADDGVEMPSDLSGVVCSGTTNWQFEVLRELKTMGYTIDFNKQF